MISLWISVVPPMMGRTLNILGSPPDHYGQGDRVGQQDAQELWHRQRFGCGRRNGLRGCSPPVLLTVALRALSSGRGPATMRSVDEALAELAAYFRRWREPPDEDLVRLAAAARAAGSRWEAIAAACDARDQDAPGAVYRPFGLIPGQGAGPLFRVTQHVVHKLTGSDRGYYSPLIWPCPGCGRQVTDRAAYGRPSHVEHGHGPGCARLARDQAADDELRRDQLPGQIVHSEDAVGPVQRHWLAGRIIDDCPRCGWHGYFHHYMATVDGDWAATVCDDCYADLHPGITVTVKFFSASFGGSEPFAVIRQRDRSDHDYPDIGHFPDIGQQMTWRLWWEHTSKLVEEAHGGADADIAEISRVEAEQITAGLAARYWPADAAGLPWVACAYPR